MRLRRPSRQRPLGQIPLLFLRLGSELALLGRIFDSLGKCGRCTLRAHPGLVVCCGLSDGLPIASRHCSDSAAHDRLQASCRGSFDLPLIQSGSSGSIEVGLRQWRAATTPAAKTAAAAQSNHVSGGLQTAVANGHQEVPSSAAGLVPNISIKCPGARDGSPGSASRLRLPA